LSVAITTSAWADASRLDAILARGILLAGTTGDYPPFTALDSASGKYSGLDIDLARSLGASLGVKVEFVPTSWPALSIDLASQILRRQHCGVSVTLERQKTGFFTQPYLRDGKTPTAPCGDATKFDTLADIDRSGLRVAVNPGGASGGGSTEASGRADGPKRAACVRGGRAVVPAA
jgi:cyclohexadienyl dehydratase